jgi:platelet-activating factor acetylhydrolase IB subunit alpha
VCLATYKHAEAVSSIAVEPTVGRLLAVGCGDSAVRVYEDGECTMTLQGHDDAVSCVAWLPNASHTLVSVSREGGIRVWDAKRGAAKASKILDGYSRVVTCGSSGLIAVGCDTMVHILRVGASDLQAVKRVGPFSSTVQTVAFANAAADAIIAEAHGSVEAKEIVKAAAKAEKQGGDVPVTDPLYIAVGGRDRDITVFDVSSGAKMFAFSDHENWVRQLAFSANGKHLLSCSDDSSIRAYDLATKRTARVIENAHDHFVTCLAAHPNIPLLASGSSVPDIKVWRCGL